MEMTSTARQALERLIVQNLIDGALAAGWRVPFVDDGGDELVKCKTVTEAMDAVFSVDECWIHFVGPKVDKRHTVAIILGNGIDCVSDHSIGEDFQRDVMDKSNAFVEYLEAGGADGLYAMECAKSAELLAAITRLSFAAMARDNTMGDQCGMMAAQAELRDANKAAIEAIANAKGVVAA